MALAARANPRPATVVGDSPDREWWAAQMSDDQYIALVREIETEKGRMTAHEQVCAERYKRLDEKIDGFQESLTGATTAFTKALNDVKAAVATTDSRGAKWKDKVLYTVVAVLFAYGCWSAGQLWSLLPLHH